MFYVPLQENDQYSEGFRKLIKRVLLKLNRQQEGMTHNDNERKKISSTVDYNQMSSIRKKQPLKDFKKPFPYILKQNGNIKQSSNKLLLPKLQTPISKLKIRGQQLSHKFIRSSDKNIREMLDNYQQLSPLNEKNKNLSFSSSISPVRRRKPPKSRKIKSECIQSLNEKINLMKNLKQEQKQGISPWALNATSHQYFADAKEIV